MEPPTLPVKGGSPRSCMLGSGPRYTRMESFPLQLMALSLDRHPSRLTLTAPLDTDAKRRAVPRSNATSRMQPPKPGQQGETGHPQGESHSSPILSVLGGTSG